MEELPLIKILYLPLHLENEQKALLRELRKNARVVTGELLSDDWFSILKTARDFKPQIILTQVQGDEQCNIPFFKKLKELDTFIINWNGDVRWGVPDFMVRLGKVIDLTLITNKTQLPYLSSAGVNAAYWQVTYDPEVFKPLGLKKKYDVSFFGSNYPDFPDSPLRFKMLQEVDKEFDLHIFGTGWGGFKNLHPQLNNEDSAVAINESKVVLGISAFNNMECYTSDRAMRTMGCGTYYAPKEWKGMESEGFSRRVCGVWEDIGEALALLRVALDYMPDAREETAKDGYEFIRDSFGPEAQVNKLKELLKWEM